jgi:glyoxylase-like metal-dependent hydrolase (beta-lactamase superfamily II)
MGMKAFVKPEEEIGPQLEALGFPLEAVRWLVMTHLHTDHAGGLYHFPRSEILVSRTEYELAAGFKGQLRGFLSNHWPTWFDPTLVDFEARPVGAFPESFMLTKAGDVHLVPTPGHTAGHLSVIVEAGDTTYFLAGDTSYTEQMMLAQVVDGVSQDTQVARQTLARTLQYVQDTPTVYLPSHDPDSANRLARRQVVTSQRDPQLQYAGQ